LIDFVTKNILKNKHNYTLKRKRRKIMPVILSSKVDKILRKSINITLICWNYGSMLLLLHHSFGKRSKDSECVNYRWLLRRKLLNADSINITEGRTGSWLHKTKLNSTGWFDSCLVLNHPPPHSFMFNADDFFF
jgi:hypothetical protein